jgi:iron complex outermembrane recepter protein
VLGFRLTGWYREDGGYVDRVDSVTGATLDVNANRYFSELVRGALTFAPSASVQVTPSLTYQSIRVRDTSTFDSSLSDPGHGVFKNPSLVPQPSEDTYYLASVKLTARLHAGDLRAVASYFDQTGSAVIFGTDYFTLQQRVYSADVRLSSQDQDGTLTWVAGLFSSDEQAHHPHFSPPGVYVDTAVTDQSRVEGFGQIAWKVTPRLTATAGVRVGHSNYHYSDDAPPIEGETSDTWYAPRLGLSWQADEENLIYLTVSKGYGSPTFYPLTDTPTPADTLWSYEIGSKHDLLDGRLHFETSVFHIEWDNGSVSPDLLLGTERLTLPGKAVSNGFGLSTQAWVTQQTKVAVDVAYTRCACDPDDTYARGSVVCPDRGLAARIALEGDGIDRAGLPHPGQPHRQPARRGRVQKHPGFHLCQRPGFGVLPRPGLRSLSERSQRPGRREIVEFRSGGFSRECAECAPAPVRHCEWCGQHRDAHAGLHAHAAHAQRVRCVAVLTIR